MRYARWLSIAIVLFFGGTTLNATEDPSGRVARVSFVEGSVSQRSSDSDDWYRTTLNYPLTLGDHLWTDTNSRAELHIGSSAIRLAPQTALEFAALDDRRVRLRITEGSVSITVRELDDQMIEVDAPSGQIVLARPGVYRIDAAYDGRSDLITVRRGDARVTSDYSTFDVRDSQSASIAPEQQSFDLRPAAGTDAWDDWCVARDRREDDASSARYVSREMTGYEDLDTYGRWHVVAGYGPVWVPTAVNAGWAPYRYGHWVYVQPWGWTWVDDAPWGFAPFHYGRWAYLSGGWAWVPGTFVARPVYAPALVAFVGGPRWNVAVGVGGGVGWFPLAPGEAYYPAYHVSPTYVRNVNVTNVNITNINVTNVNVANTHYRNRDVSGAVTVVSHETFVSARPVDRGLMQVRPRELADAPVIDRVPDAPARRLGPVIGRGNSPRPVEQPLARRPEAIQPRNAAQDDRQSGMGGRRSVPNERIQTARTPDAPQRRQDDRPSHAADRPEGREQPAPADRPMARERPVPADRGAVPDRSMASDRPAASAPQTRRADRRVDVQSANDRRPAREEPVEARRPIPQESVQDHREARDVRAGRDTRGPSRPAESVQRQGDDSHRRADREPARQPGNAENRR